jgi:ATP-dependent protease ClpP protease subunit
MRARSANTATPSLAAMVLGGSPIGMPRALFEERIRRDAGMGDRLAKGLLASMANPTRTHGRPIVVESAVRRRSAKGGAVQREAYKSEPVDPAEALYWQQEREREALEAQFKAAGGVARLGMFGAITDNPTAQSTCPAVFQARVKAIAAAKPRVVLLLVDSTGGSAPAGLGMIRAIQVLQSSGIPVIADVQRADSMAALVATSCDYVVVAPEGSVMVHALTGGLDEHREILTGRVREILGARTFLTPAEIEGMTDASAGRDFEFSAWESVRCGLADEVGAPTRAGEIAMHLASGGWWSTCGAYGVRRSTLSQRRAMAERALLGSREESP